MAGANTSQECVRAHSNVNDLRHFFVSKLTEALRMRISPTKAPPGFVKSLEKTCQTQGPSLSKTLLKTDIIVYIAYFLAEENLEGLDRLSTEDLTLVATEVASAPRDANIDKFITHFFKTSQRSKKYNAMVDSVNREHAMSSELASTDSATSTGTTRDEQRFVADIDATRDEEHSTVNNQVTHNQEHSMANIETTHNRAHPTVNAETTHNREQSATNIEITHNRDRSTANNISYSGQYFTPLYKTIGFNIDTSKQIPCPPVSSLSNVFPVYLTRVIVKAEDGSAWVRISYSDPTQSVMEMFISASETQHIAKELFDLNITTQKKVRGVLLDNNVVIEMKDSITLSGSPINKVVKLLGTLASEAYQRSSMRIEEVAQGMLTITYCLTMEVWPDADCPSRLMLRADVATLSTIVAHLWPGPY